MSGLSPARRGVILAVSIAFLAIPAVFVSFRVFSGVFLVFSAVFECFRVFSFSFRMFSYAFLCFRWFLGDLLAREHDREYWSEISVRV